MILIYTTLRLKIIFHNGKQFVIYQMPASSKGFLNGYKSQIYNITGPMFAGKTETLLAWRESALKAGLRCVLVKPQIDNRYSEKCVTTHSRKSAIADFVTNTLELLLGVQDMDIVFIDEGHMFPNLGHVAKQLQSNGFGVVVSTLNGTWQQRPFKNVLELNRYSTEIQLTSICTECKQPTATMTKRKTEEKDEIVVGGAEKYYAVCANCI